MQDLIRDGVAVITVLPAVSTELPAVATVLKELAGQFWQPVVAGVAVEEKKLAGQPQSALVVLPAALVVAIGGHRMQSLLVDDQ